MLRASRGQVKTALPRLPGHGWLRHGRFCYALHAMQHVERAIRDRVRLAAPPSKAHTLRALFLAGLADGETVIASPLLGEDQLAAISCLRTLGVAVDVPSPDRVVVRGCAGRPQPSCAELDVNESGVTMNFLAAVACLSASPVRLTGRGRICRRPVRELVSGLRQLGCRVDYAGTEGFPPLIVHGGGIPGGEARMSGAVTSQYFSALLAAAPFADGPVSLSCTDEMTEKPYVCITLEMMQHFGVNAEESEMRLFRVPNAGGYRAADVTVEGDWSGATFLLQAAAVCGIEVSVTGLRPDSCQGDRCIAEILANMGCEVDICDDCTTVRGPVTTAIEADMADTPDLVPAVAVTGAFLDRPSRLTHIGHLRHKECDRLEVIGSQLARMGASVASDDSSLTVCGTDALHGSRIDPHNDHRIAMSFAVAGLALGGQEIEAPECVAKSFPGFWDALRQFF